MKLCLSVKKIHRKRRKYVAGRARTIIPYNTINNFVMKKGDTKKNSKNDFHARLKSSLSRVIINSCEIRNKNTNIRMKKLFLVAASGSYVYVAWHDDTPVSGSGTAPEIWLRVGS